MYLLNNYKLIKKYDKDFPLTRREVSFTNHVLMGKSYMQPFYKIELLSKCKKMVIFLVLSPILQLEPSKIISKNVKSFEANERPWKFDAKCN